MNQRGLGIREIARTLCREPSTVSRKLRRNGTATGYASVPAQAASGARREAARPMAKLHPQGRLWMVVTSCLAWHWSPQQIAGALRRMWPDDPTMHVSHETIYTAIYAHAGSCPKWSASMCVRPRCRTEGCPGVRAGRTLTTLVRFRPASTTLRMCGSRWKPFDTWPRWYREDRRRRGLLPDPPSSKRMIDSKGKVLPLPPSEIELASRIDGAPFQRPLSVAYRPDPQRLAASATDPKAEVEA